MPPKGQKARRAMAKARAAPRCAIAHCENQPGTGPVCHPVCDECLSRMLIVSCCGDVGMQCALCRVKYCLSEKVIKTVMAKHVPSHAIVLENKCCDKKYVLTHQPCEHGCYVCEEADLDLLEL